MTFKFHFFFPQDDMQRGVHGRFLDQSTSVREAAVELVGKFILIRPELIPKYYDMLCDRILVSFFPLCLNYVMLLILSEYVVFNCISDFL